MSLLTTFQKLPLSIAQLSLAAVIQCGQSFRWSTFPLLPENGDAVITHEYRLCLPDRVVCLRQSPDTLFYRSVFPDPPSSPIQRAVRDAETLVWIKDYFQLDIDLTKLYRTWSERDPIFRDIQGRFSGIRILRQDPWENLISFICSSNNNISRISRMVKSLCKHYSPPLVSIAPPSETGESESYHPFPPPSALVAPDVATTLRTLGFGYRANFIQKTAQMLVEEHGFPNGAQGVEEPAVLWLAALRDVSTAKARAELLKLMGVGRKVADCVLLMSLDKREVVPVDTHVHQIAHKHYGVRMASGGKGGKVVMTPKLYDEVSTKLAEVWGEYAGWAHSVLFTADLKSFATYNLPSDIGLPTPPDTPRNGSSKRKRGNANTIVTAAVDEAEVEIDATLDPNDESSSSLAERVKKRRRVSVR